MTKRPNFFLSVLIFTLISWHTSLGDTHIPADYLVPPPLPTPQRLQHSNSPYYTPTGGVPLTPYNGGETQQGFMTRIARWFGFGPDAAPRDQLLASDSQLNAQFKHPPNNKAYHYSKPDASQNDKQEPCNLCNKYPWVPMMHASVPYPASANQFQQNSWSDLQAPQATSIKQRAVQFHFPSQQLYQPHKPVEAAAPFIPIPVPNLSGSALPPLYNAQPFRPIFSSVPPATSQTTTAQRSEMLLPSTEPAHFAENVGAFSELRPDHVFATRVPPTKSANFEIIKSHQVTDFVSSVEYPATFVQSPTIDVESIPLPANHKPAEESVSTVAYQHENFNSNLDNHIPASQILTELGNFRDVAFTPEYSTQPPQTDEQTTAPQPFESQSLTSYEQPIKIQFESSASDSFPSASSHNLTEIQSNNNFNVWSALSNELFYSTTEHAYFIDDTSTPSPEELETDFTTGRPRETTVAFVPSTQHELLQHQIAQPESSFNHRERETPNRLLDAPIRHGHQGSTQTFTKDPSKLGLRLVAGSPKPQQFQHPNHAYMEHHDKPADHRLLGPVFPVAVTQNPAAPTPTSTYGAIDASGHLAGMSPPAPPPPRPPSARPLQQIVIPYTTKNQPRPFEPTAIHNVVTPSFVKWSHSNGVDPFEQQESKLVNAATEVPPNARRTTKYLTKILASNLRELLKREHESRNKSYLHSFDISKLQKNIDDWTEQEYTSLSHRPSTPTIRGRSKHIPHEYLTTTTPSPRQAKTTNGFENTSLSASINNLEPLLRDRGTKFFQYAPIVDNRLTDQNEPSTRLITSSTTTSTTSTTTQKTPSVVELWKKAKVAISPQTKEKIYVVTPQPLFFPQRQIVTEAPPLSKSSKSKAPRFLVRPTPGNGTSPRDSISAASTYYASEAFGLAGISAFVPAAPVEIIDGNSKVLTVVTPVPSASKRADGNESHKSRHSGIQRRSMRPTMLPSPR